MSVIASLIATSIWAVIGYWWIKDNLASLIAQGVELTDLQQTSDGLAEVQHATANAMDLLEKYRDSVTTTLIISIRGDFQRLRQQLERISVTEYYSATELNQLADSFSFAQEKKDFIAENMGKPKRMASGTVGLGDLLARIDTTLETLDRQLDVEPRIDITELRRELASIDRKTSEVKAALDSRKAATLATLQAIDPRTKRNATESTGAHE